MTSLLNNDRPAVFCPGCSHDTVLHALDKALTTLGMTGSDVAIVTDIGCSGLFDTFFKTHALHGLHGRALTYATGLKMARPDLTVITIMGDGGLGIGGAHVLSSCRRNLDITLLILNNFNYGMTGGQCSATTPLASRTASGFLNQLEQPLDICSVGKAAGAPYTKRIMSTDNELAASLAEAITFNGFSITDIWGICPGRYSKKNKSSLKQIKADFTQQPAADGINPANTRREFGDNYRQNLTKTTTPLPPGVIPTLFPPSLTAPCEILFLGGAGQRINTAGEIVCLSAMTAGMHASLKNDYPITVLRGHSICEAVISPELIGFTGIDKPRIIIALSQEGVNRKQSLFNRLNNSTHIIASEDLSIPDTAARITTIDFQKISIARSNYALASLAVLCKLTEVISTDMLFAGLQCRFSDDLLDDANRVIRTCTDAIYAYSF